LFWAYEGVIEMGNGVPVPGGGGGPPQTACDTPQCQAALGALATARRQVIAQCAIVESAKTTLFILQALAILMLAIAISLFIAAAGFFSALNILEGLATAAAGAALFATFLLFLPKIAAASRQYQTQLTELNNDRSNFSAVANNVEKDCPQPCWGDLSIPGCPD
jgi:hypothetical protein